MAPKPTLTGNNIFTLRRLAVIFLCVFVFVLAFAAKRAQYDGPAEHGVYLKQCVKMENRVVLDPRQPCPGIENAPFSQCVPTFSSVLNRQLLHLTSAPLTIHPPLLI
jgi:hypothetical protein